MLQVIIHIHHPASDQNSAVFLRYWDALMRAVLWKLCNFQPACLDVCMVDISWGTIVHNIRGINVERLNGMQPSSITAAKTEDVLK